MKRAKQITFGLLGIVLVMLGIVGIILPILPGWGLIFVGLILISLESPIVDQNINMLVSKNKKLEYYYLKTRFWVRNNLGYEID
jgi:uncharacterized membrane protein YbaN (DUF454 family)